MVRAGGRFPLRLHPPATQSKGSPSAACVGTTCRKKPAQAESRCSSSMKRSKEVASRNIDVPSQASSFCTTPRSDIPPPKCRKQRVSGEASTRGGTLGQNHGLEGRDRATNSLNKRLAGQDFNFDSDDDLTDDSCSSSSMPPVPRLRLERGPLDGKRLKVGEIIGDRTPFQKHPPACGAQGGTPFSSD